MIEECCGLYNRYIIFFIWLTKRTYTPYVCFVVTFQTCWRRREEKKLSFVKILNFIMSAYLHYVNMGIYVNLCEGNIVTVYNLHRLLVSIQT